jgi:hypothetical protein
LLTVYIGSFYLGTVWGFFYEIIEVLNPRKHTTKNLTDNDIRVLKSSKSKDPTANHSIQNIKLLQPIKNSNVKRISKNSKNGKTAAKKREESPEKRWITKKARKALHFADNKNIANSRLPV